MKARDLNVGNLYNHTKAGIITLDGEWISYFCKFPELLEGIPLTEEWLLKIDMPEDGSTKDLLGSYDIWFERVGNELYLKTETSSKKIEFVHIAQNIAFCLTGEELGVNK